MFTKSLEEKISTLTHKNMELQTIYNNALETVGRMAVHANMLEKELNHMREKYNSLLEKNELFKEYPSWVHSEHQRERDEHLTTRLGTDEKRSLECSPKTAFEAGHITRQTNAPSYLDAQDKLPVYTTLRRSTRSKRI